MFFNREQKKKNFVKAKTPEARKFQKEAIAAYYAKKRNETENKKIRNTKNVTYFFISSVSFYKLSFDDFTGADKSASGLNAVCKRIDKSTQCVLQYLGMSKRLL